MKREAHLVALAVPGAKGTVHARTEDAPERGPTAAAATAAGCPEEDRRRGLMGRRSYTAQYCHLIFINFFPSFLTNFT